MDERRRVRLSKRIARVLRHAPESVGLRLDPNGWVDVDDLLGALRISRADLDKVVRGDDKSRYTLAGRRIRAAQGHSVDVDLGLPPAVPPPVLWHGTSYDVLSAVLTEGLRPMRRRLVHLSPDPQTARRVGARHGRTAVLEVDAAAMTRDGAVFWRADNGVWLVDAVPPGRLRRLG